MTYFHRRGTHKSAPLIIRKDTPPVEEPIVERREPTAAECAHRPVLAVLAGHDPGRVATYEWSSSKWSSR